LKIKTLLSRGEQRVDQILRKRLEDSGYRILPSVRLEDAIGKNPCEYLPPEEFGFLTRSHLDFLVVNDSYPLRPVFAVEFDGPQHEEPLQKQRDVLKNRLCQRAGLPLLRVAAADIELFDEVTLLDYMLSRFLAWPREYPRLLSEIEEEVNEMDPEERVERLVDDPFFDPSFRFDSKNPFPALSAVKERLAHRFGVIFNKCATAHGDGLYCEWNLVAENCGGKDQYWASRQSATLTRWQGGSGTVVARIEREAAVRSWLPVEQSCPDWHRLTPLNLATSISQVDEWLARLEAMWFPSIPGISASSIAQAFAEYLAYRGVEHELSRGAVKTVARGHRTGLPVPPSGMQTK
jgi:hypothetical protein